MSYIFTISFANTLWVDDSFPFFHIYIYMYYILSILKNFLSFPRKKTRDGMRDLNIAANVHFLKYTMSR